MNILSTMRKVLLAASLCLFMAGTSLFAQNVISVTDGQPYTEGFEGNGFELWTVDSTGGGLWSVLMGTQSSVASFSYTNNGDEGRLISPVLDISSVTEATLTYSYAMMGIYTNDVLEISYRSSETDTWHVLGSHSLSDFNNFYEQTYTLPDLSSTYQISFKGQGGGGIYLFVDNITVASTSSCARPINVAANDITPTSALLSWSTTGNEASWTIELNGVETVVNTQPYLMEGLTPQTDHTLRVKANCSGDSESDWSTPIIFTTMCDVFVVNDEVPYFDDFESSGNFVCWQTEIISGTDNWTVDPGYLILNNTAFFIWLGGEARLISVPLDLTAVTNPTLTFKHKQLEGASGPDEMSVWYRTTPEGEWQWIHSFVLPTEDWETASFTLPNPSSSYQISFYAIAHNSEGVYVDDVMVGNASGDGIEEHAGIIATAYPNPSTGKITVKANMANGEALVYDIYGKQIAAASIVDGHAEFDLSDYSSGIYVVRLSGDGGNTTVKIVKE